MSHEIESVNGRASMVFAGETPWHGLGHRLEGNESANEIRELAGLDWNVEVEPLYRKIDGEFVEFPLANAVSAIWTTQISVASVHVGPRIKTSRCLSAFGLWSKTVL